MGHFWPDSHIPQHMWDDCSPDAIKGHQLTLLGHVLRGFVAQMVFWDSLHESSVIAEGDEQLGPYAVQDHELVVLQ